MKIYVGNLSYDVTEDELRQEFSSFGEVTSVSIPTDRYSGRPRGFAFVEMPSRSEAELAIKSLNGKIIRERTLQVSEARPPSADRGGRGFGGDRRSGGRPFDNRGRQRRY